MADTTEKAPPQSLAGAYWLELLNLVPYGKRGRALELMMGISAEVGKDVLVAENSGHKDGKEAAAADARREGFSEGWAAAVADMTGPKLSSTAELQANDPTVTLPTC